MNETPIDPITTEVVKNALIYASEEMGIAVRNAAYSPNIKERLDHSCALFDRSGRLIAQAEHIPVHLGSLPWGLQRTLEVLAERGICDARRASSGSSTIPTSPARTSTTSPSFVRSSCGDAFAGYSANKAHHADVGGAVPGSMSADARDLVRRRLILPPMRLVARRPRRRRDRRTLSCELALARRAQRRPARASWPAMYTGERRLLELSRSYGVERIRRGDRAHPRRERTRMRAALARAGRRRVDAPRTFWKTPAGAPSIRIRVDARRCATARLRSITRGPSRSCRSPLNAVFGVTLSGVYYALRAVTDQTIPMNEGCFRPGRRSPCREGIAASIRGGRRRSAAETSRRARATPTSAPGARASRARTASGAQSAAR